MNDNEVFDQNRNVFGNNIKNQFSEFLNNFQLEPTDPNYAQYADGVMDHQEG